MKRMRKRSGNYSAKFKKFTLSMKFTLPKPKYSMTAKKLQEKQVGQHHMRKQFVWTMLRTILALILPRMMFITGGKNLYTLSTFMFYLIVKAFYIYPETIAHKGSDEVCFIFLLLCIQPFGEGCDSFTNIFRFVFRAEQK